MESVRDAGFCHDAKLGGVNLLWTCVESSETQAYSPFAVERATKGHQKTF